MTVRTMSDSGVSRAIALKLAELRQLQLDLAMMGRIRESAEVAAQAARLRQDCENRRSD